jgi:hypothetical protein
MKLDIQMFASTNKTANYELPQFVGTDKPTWLGDINGAMTAIDAGMAENKADIESMDTRVSSAEASASSASQAVTTLTGRVATVESGVSSATSTANNAQQTATSALNTANTANGKADSNTSDISSLTTRVSTCENNISLFNLNTFTTATLTKVSGNYTIASGSQITVATNSDGSLAKVYGVITCNNVQTAGTLRITTSLRPESAITINGGLLRHNNDSNASHPGRLLASPSFTINTDGTIDIEPVWTSYAGETCRFVFINSLLFIKDFGDSSIPDGE